MSNSSTVVTIRGLKATEEGKPASVKVSFSVKKTGKTSKYSYVSKVNVIDEKQAVTAAATGAKKVTVSFNKALATTSGVAITVKKGTTTLSQKAVSFTDAKTAVVELNQSLTTGKYTADVAGLEEGAMTAEFAVDSEEYVAKIELLSTKAPMTAVSATSATISYTLKNQYEEVMQTSVNTPNFTISTAVTPDKGVYKNGKGSLTLKTNAAAFIPGDKVYISGVMQSGSHVATMSDQVEIVLPASFAKADFKGVYNSTLKKMDTVQSAKLTGAGKYTYYVLFTVKDQYENDLDSVKQVIEASPLQFTALSTNPGFITTPTNLSSSGALKDFDVDGVTYVGVRLDAGTMSDKGGTATIQITSSTNGTQSTYEVVADAAGALDTLQIGTPAEYVVLGEKVEIPYEAKDQYGNAITSFDALNTNVTFTDGLNSIPKLAFEKQTDGSAKLYLDLKNQGDVGGVPNERQDLVAYLTSVVNSNGNYSSTSVSIKPAAYPAAVLGINAKSSVTTTMPLNTEDVIIKYTDLDIADQYGRTMKSSSVEKFLSAASVISFK